MTPPETSVQITTANALSHPSRRRIVDVLRRQPEGMSVGEIAPEVDLHHNAVRQHLTRLSSAGLVAVTRAEPTGRGRPRLLYHVVEDEIPPVTAHQELVRMLVRYLARSGASPEDVEAFGYREGLRLGERGGRSALVEAFTRLGFGPREITRPGSRNDTLELRLEHCPFQAGATETGGNLVCILHRGIAAGMAARASDRGRLTEWHPQDPVTAGCSARFEGLDSSGSAHDNT